MTGTRSALELAHLLFPLVDAPTFIFHVSLFVIFFSLFHSWAKRIMTRRYWIYCWSGDWRADWPARRFTARSARGSYRRSRRLGWKTSPDSWSITAIDQKRGICYSWRADCRVTCWTCRRRFISHARDSCEQKSSLSMAERNGWCPIIKKKKWWRACPDGGDALRAPFSCLSSKRSNINLWYISDAPRSVQLLPFSIHGRFIFSTVMSLEVHSRLTTLIGRSVAPAHGQTHVPIVADAAAAALRVISISTSIPPDAMRFSLWPNKLIRK